MMKKYIKKYIIIKGDSMKNRIVIDQNKCTGCGVCANVCMNSVIQIVNHKAHVVNEKRCDINGYCMQFCPNNAISFQPKVKTFCEGDECFGIDSELFNWPVQITNVSCNNRYLEDSKLLIAADCSAYAYASFHQDFIRDHTVLIACPKNDLTNHLLEKCSVLFQNVHFESIEVIAMNAPCCKKLLETIREALRLSGKEYSLYERIITPDGEVFE